MKSTAKDVASYLRGVPEDRLEALDKLRKLCLGTLQGYQECMDYDMPGYKRNGIVEVAFASQKNYISLYILKQDVVSANRGLLKGLKMGKKMHSLYQAGEDRFRDNQTTAGRNT